MNKFLSILFTFWFVVTAYNTDCRVVDVARGYDVAIIHNGPVIVLTQSYGRKYAIWWTDDLKEITIRFGGFLRSHSWTKDGEQIERKYKLCRDQI